MKLARTRDDADKLIPNPNDVRDAIDAVDEQARLLRRLLRLSLRLYSSQANVDKSPPIQSTQGKGGQS